MSKESVQFAEMARQEVDKNSAFARFKRTFELYCERCNDYKPHQLRVHGEWEHYICCTCGATQRFRVRQANRSLHVLVMRPGVFRGGDHSNGTSNSGVYALVSNQPVGGKGGKL